MALKLTVQYLVKHINTKCNSRKPIHGFIKYSIAPKFARNLSSSSRLQNEGIQQDVDKRSSISDSLSQSSIDSLNLIHYGGKANGAVSTDPVGILSTYINVFDSLLSSKPVLKCMSCLQSAHEFSGLPWWGTIVLSTVVLRTAITFPLSVYQQYIIARVELLKGEMMKIMQQIANEVRVAKRNNNWDEQTARRVFKLSNKKQWQRLIERDNCHPAKGVILILGQLPLWITLSLSYRNLCTAKPFRDIVAERTFYELYAEGLLWFPHLTYPDPVVVLPLLMALVNLTITEIHSLQRPEAEGTRQKVMKNFFRFVSVMTFPIALFMPSGVVLYWVTSSSCALAQTLILLHPKVRSTCGIPLTPSYSHPHPYRKLATSLLGRIKNNNKSNGEKSSSNKTN